MLGLLLHWFLLAQLVSMSQNREIQDRAGVVKGLSARAIGDDLEMAEIGSRRITKSN